MSRNPQLTYQDLLVQADQEARDDYEFDPRVQFYSSELRGPLQPGYEQPNARTTAADADARYDLEGCEDKQEEEEDDKHAKRNDCRSVQPPPKMKEKKIVVVMDTAQRDWTLQPNAYQLSFKFGSPSVSNCNAVQKIPVFSNSRYIPITAIQNSNQVFYQPNIAGFTMSAGGGVLSFPPYNPFASPGPIVTYDIFSNNSNLVNPGNGFYTNKVLSNVTALKLAHATLPYRRFTNLTPDILTGPGNNVSGISSVHNQVTTFMSEPYMLLFLNNYQGQYVGGNDPVNRAFSVLAPAPLRPTLLPTSPIGTQFNDFYPWSDEKYEFSSPEAYIKSFDLTLTKNTGLSYAQIDDIAITAMKAISWFNLGFIAPGPPYSVVIFECTILRTQDPCNSVYFNRNELRLGDRIKFYQPALSNLIADPSLNASPYASDYSNVFTWMTSNDVYLLSEYYESNTINTKGTDFYNKFTFAYDPLTTYGTLATSPQIGIQGFLVNPLGGLVLTLSTASGTILPILNTNVQATFAFDVFTQVPDTSHLSAQVVN